MYLLLFNGQTLIFKFVGKFLVYCDCSMQKVEEKNDEVQDVFSEVVSSESNSDELNKENVLNESNSIDLNQQIDDAPDNENHDENEFDKEIEETMKQLKTIEELKTKLASTLRKCRRLEKQLIKRDLKDKDKMECIFNEDQIKFLEQNQMKGNTWSDQTITNALKLYMACGTKGYEEIRKQKLPYPSARTLQHRLRHLKFEAGIIDDVFRLFSLKVFSFKKLFN